MVSNKKIINPAAGAIVMALGISLQTIITLLPFLSFLTPVLISLYFVVTTGILTGLGIQFFSRDFRSGLLNDPVKFFLMGTWVAGVSVSAKVILKYYPEFGPIMTIAIAFNTLLYGYYIFHCLRQFYHLWKEPGRHVPQGMVLLATVATQSLVIVWSVLKRPETLYVGVAFGLCLYVAGVVVILRHYFLTLKRGTLAEDWSNTNCIFHGALSISGFAMVMSGSFSQTTIELFWWGVFAVLIIIEGIEITRAWQRIHRYGWRKGILTYHISQWSRNFTFGMFFVFTFRVYPGPLLNVWGWIVLLLLVGEGMIFMRHNLNGALKGARSQ